MQAPPMDVRRADAGYNPRMRRSLPFVIFALLFLPVAKRAAAGPAAAPPAWRHDGQGHRLPWPAIRRFGTSRRRHLGSVRSVGFSPDGRWVLTGSNDNTAALWDAATGERVRTFKGHSSRIDVARFSPDGRRILTACWDDTARIWDVKTGRTLHVLKRHGRSITDGAFSPDGKRVATSSWDGTARVWNVKTGEQILAIDVYTTYENADPKLAGGGHLYKIAKGQRHVHAVAFHPLRDWLVTASQHRTLQCWDLKDGRLVRMFPGRRNGVNVGLLAFSPDGRVLMVAAGYSGKPIQFLDSVSGKPIWKTEGNKGFNLRAAFSRDGRLVATAAFDRVSLWDYAARKRIATFKTIPSGPVTFSPDGRRLAVGGDDLTAHIHDVESGRRLLTLEDFPDRPPDAPRPETPPPGHAAGLFAVRFNPDGTRLATGSNDRTARIWDLATGKTLRVLWGHTRYVDHLRFSPDGARLATGDYDGRAMVWNPRTGERLHALKASTRYITMLNFSPDGRMLVTCGNESYARVWDMESGKLRYQVGQKRGQLFTGVFDRSGRWLLTSSFDDYARLWDAATGEPIRRFGESKEGLQYAEFSRDGKRIVTTNWANPTERSAAKTYETETGRALVTFSGHKSLVDAAHFGPDGRYLATTSSDNTVRLWHAATGTMIRSLGGHAWEPQARFSPDGRYLLTASIKHSARVLHVPSGLEVMAFEGHHGKVYDIDWTQDSRTVATASVDTTALLWALFPPPREKALAWAGEALHADALEPGSLAKVLQAEWQELGSSSLENRLRASERLVALGEKAAGLLEENTGSPTPAWVRRQLKRLASEAYEERLDATAALMTRLCAEHLTDGSRVGEALRKLAADGAADLEARTRARSILEGFSYGAKLDAELRRLVAGIHALRWLRSVHHRRN